MKSSELCAVWGSLHDGSIVDCSVSEGEVVFDIQCLYVAEMFGDPERTFRIAVMKPVRWDPWPQRPAEREAPRLEDIARHEPDVLSAEEVGPQVGVSLLFESWNPDLPARDSGGRMMLHAEEATLTWTDGAPLATSELIAAASRYWAEFSEA